MRLDFYRLTRDFCGRTRVGRFDSFRIDIVDGDVWIRDGGQFEIFIDAAAATHIPAFEFDRDTGAAVQFRNPFDTAVRNVLLPLFAGGDVFAVSFTVDDFRLVAFRVDLNFKVMGGL